MRFLAEVIRNYRLTANSCKIIWGRLRESIDPSFPWIWSFRPCAGIHRDIETSSEPRVESLELWLRPLLGTNEAKRVDTRSWAGSRSLVDSTKSFLDLQELRELFRSLSLSFSSRSSRLTVLRPRRWRRYIDSRYPGREFRIDALCYFLRSPRANIYDIASRIAIPCNPHFRIIYVARFLRFAAVPAAMLMVFQKHRWLDYDGLKYDEKGSLWQCVEEDINTSLDWKISFRVKLQA